MSAALALLGGGGANGRRVLPGERNGKASVRAAAPRVGAALLLSHRARSVAGRPVRGNGGISMQ